MTSRRRVVGLLAILVALAWPLHNRVDAHSGLRFSSPLDGATLGDSPTHVRLTFLEKPEPSLSTIHVVDTRGVAYDAGRPETVDGDPLSIAVALRPLGRGVYTVRWRVVSAVDGHASSGSYVFGVLVAPSGPSASDGTVEAATSTAETIGRSIFLAGLVILLGAAAAHIGRFGGGRELGPAAAGWVVSIVGLALLAGAQRRVADVGFAELSGTAIGRALLWRAIAIGAAGLAIGAAFPARRASRATLVRLCLYGVALAALAAVAVHSAAGHAGAGEWPVATIGFQAAHFAAAGIWIGGLVALLAGVRGAPSDAKTTAVRRFSSMAAFGIVAVALTGTVRSVNGIPSWGDLTSTSYGGVVLVKGALLVAIAALGALNRWHSVPLAATNLQPLRRAASVELVLAAIAVAAAGYLATLPPPIGERPISGIAASGSDFGTTVRARLTAPSDQPGPNRFVVHVADYDSKQPVHADRVTLRFTPLDDPGVAPTSLALTQQPDHSYNGSGANLTFDGRWRVSVQIERAGSSVEVPLEVETASARQPVSVERLPGQAPNYTVLVPGMGHMRFTPDPERAGHSQLIVSCLDVISEYRAMEQMVVTAVEADGVMRQQPLRRLDRNRFAADIELRSGPNRIVAIARSGDGMRMRAAVEIDVAPR